MLRDLVAFEWRYHTRQVTFLAAALLFLAFGFILPATGFGPDNLAINSPFLVMQTTAFLSLLSVFVVAVFGSNAVLRDPEYRMLEIVYSTPVSRFDFLAGRAIGVFLASLTAVSFSLISMVAATLMPWIDPARIAPFDPLRYLWAFVTLSVPNVLFATVLLLAIAVLTRNALATYAGAVVIYVLYFVVAALTNSPMMAQSRPGAVPGSLAAILDPFGMTAFFDITRYWPAAVKATRFVPLEGMLLYNRLLWIGLAIAGAAFVYRRFSFRLAKQKHSKVAIEVKESPLPAKWREGQGEGPKPDPRPSPLASYLSQARLELRVLRSLPVLLLLLVWLGLAATEIHSDLSINEYGGRRYPATSLIIATLRDPSWIIGVILLIYYGAEMFWREQRHRMAAIIDSTPVSGAVMIAAKWTAMVALIVAVIALGILPGIAIQLAGGYFHIEPLVYLSLFWFSGVPLMLIGALVLFVNALSPGKYAAMVLTLAAVIFTRAASSIGLDHPLWKFAGAPPVRYSDMNGFGHDPAAFNWLMLHWAALGLLFAMLAAAVWRRIGHSVADRLRAAARHEKRAWALAAIALAFLTGGWVFYNTNVVNRRVTLGELNDWKAAYERAYKRTESLPQPRITNITATVDLVPQERRYASRGHYDVVNESNVPIRMVLVSVRTDARGAVVSMPNARASRDQRFGMIRFDLNEPLAPGARTRVDFDLQFAERGFEERPDDAIVRNGSFIFNFRCFPGVGYRKSYELRDARERRKRGLAGSGEKPLPDEGPGDGAATLERVHFDLTLSTSADQIAIGPGRLERSWEANGRRHFRYRSDAPIFNRFAIASARFDVARRSHHGVDIELYHHPEHRVNVERTLDAAVAAFDYCQKNFGPYPSGQLRLVEVPSYWPFGGFAMPETVFLVETRTLLFDGRDPDRVDVLARRVAHEVAHQWWGHKLAPANVEGGSLLMESVTKYVDNVVLERMYGRDPARQVLEFELDRYLGGRAAESVGEPPLYKVRGEDYIYYSKGLIALSAIRERIGEERLNLALRNLVTEFDGRGGIATSRDLLRHLHGVAGPEHAELLDEWLKEIILYDFRIDSATTKRRPDGRYDVTLRVHGSKVRADERGNETPLPFREPVAIAVDQHVAKHELRDGMNTVTITVDAQPAYALVDPELTRIDVRRTDNEKRIH